MKLRSLYSFLSRNSYLVPIGIVLLTSVLLFLTLAPSSALGDSSLWSYDKLGHFLMFGSWTFFIGLYNYINTKSSLGLWTVFAIGVFFGALIEFLQYAMPFHRDPDFYDFLFDALGCVAAVWFLKLTTPEPAQVIQNSQTK